MLFVAGACTSNDDAASGGSIAITDARLERPANPDVAAVRLTIANTTGEDDALLAVTTPDADEAGVHRSETNEAGLTTMDEVDRLDLPAGDSIEFAPGTLHIMVEQPTRTLDVGDEITMTFSFDNAPDQTIRIPVVELGGTIDDEETNSG